MICPHCNIAIHDRPHYDKLGEDHWDTWISEHQVCPECHRLIVLVRNQLKQVRGRGQATEEYFVVPRKSTRPHPPPEVPPELAQDYIEAALVIADSPKASAALSRRCLQHLLREHADIKNGDLAKEIDEVIASKSLPSHLVQAIDAIRNIGNFAAHPIKSQSSGEIVPVEPGEAEWNLEVLDGLFDFYFVQPVKLAAKKAALVAKLKDAGKPAMK